MKRLLMIPAIAALLYSTATFAIQTEGEAVKHHGHPWKERAAQQWEKLKADLKLNPAQDFAWQEIAEKRSAMHKERRADRTQLKEALTQELAKPEPDFARIVEHKRQVEEKGLQVRNQLRDMQLKLYASFNPEQKAVIRDVMKARLERMQQWREKKRGTS